MDLLLSALLVCDWGEETTWAGGEEIWRTGDVGDGSMSSLINDEAAGAEVVSNDLRPIRPTPLAELSDSLSDESSAAGS